MQKIYESFTPEEISLRIAQDAWGPKETLEAPSGASKVPVKECVCHPFGYFGGPGRASEDLVVYGFCMVALQGLDSFVGYAGVMRRFSPLLVRALHGGADSGSYSAVPSWGPSVSTRPNRQLF